MKPYSITYYLGLACGLVCLTSGIAQADTATFIASADSYIRASQTAQGANANILFGDTASANDYLRGVLAFDLTNPLLTGATINSVTLSLTVNIVDTGGSQPGLQTIELRALTSSFANNTVTWTSRNGTDNWVNPGGDFGGVLATTTADATTVVPGSNLVFSGAGLTSSASSAIGGSYYLLLKLQTEDATRSIFRVVADNGGTTGFSTLTIDYTPVPEPSAAVLAVGGIVLSFTRRRLRQRG